MIEEQTTTTIKVHPEEEKQKLLVSAENNNMNNSTSYAINKPTMNGDLSSKNFSGCVEKRESETQTTPIILTTTPLVADQLSSIIKASHHHRHQHQRHRHHDKETTSESETEDSASEVGDDSDSSTSSESRRQKQNNALMCRICHCEETSEEYLIAPCYCSGTLRYVHQSCLQQWLKKQGTKSCELCKFEFIMQTRIRSLKNWEKLDINHIERRKILCSVTFHLIVITCVVWSLYVLIERTAQEMSRQEFDWAFWIKLVVVAIGFTGGVVFMYIQCKMYVQLCMRWRRYNRVIIIQPITPELLLSNSRQVQLRSNNNNNNNNNTNNKLPTSNQTTDSITINIATAAIDLNNNSNNNNNNNANKINQDNFGRDVNSSPPPVVLDLSHH